MCFPCSCLLAEEKPNILNELAKGLGQSLLPAAAGLYTVSATKDAIKELIAAKRSQLTNKSLLIRTQDTKELAFARATNG